MNEDQTRNRDNNSAYNLAILRHMAQNLMHKDRSPVSLRSKFNLVGWQEQQIQPCRLGKMSSSPNSSLT